MMIVISRDFYLNDNRISVMVIIFVTIFLNYFGDYSMKFLLKVLSLTFLTSLFHGFHASAADCSDFINKKNDLAIITYFLKVIDESGNYIQDMKYTKIKHIFPSVVPTLDIYYKVKFADSAKYKKYVVKVVADSTCQTITPVGEPLPQDFR